MPHPLTRNVTALHHNYMSQCGNFSPSLVGHTDDRWRAGSRAYQLRIRLKDSHRRAGVVRRFVRKSSFHAHTRDIYWETGDAAGLPAQLLGNGDNWNEIVFGKEKIFCTWLIKKQRADKNFLYSMSPTNQPRKEPIIYSAWVPICLSFISFNSQQGPPLSGLSRLD